MQHKKITRGARLVLLMVLASSCSTDGASKKSVSMLEERVAALENRVIETESLLMLTRANGWKRVKSQPALETMLDCAAKGGDLRCVPIPELASALRALDCYTGLLVDAQSKDARRGKLDIRPECQDEAQGLHISPADAGKALTLLRQGSCFGKPIERVDGAVTERQFSDIDGRLATMRAEVEKSKKTRKLLESPEAKLIIERFEKVRPLFEGASIKGAVHEMRCLEGERTLSIVLTEMDVKGKVTLTVESLGSKEGW